MNNQYLCRDCGKSLQLDYQEQRRGEPLAIVTCKNPDCDLWSVTLSLDVYEALTDEKLAEYRKMVVSLKERFKKLKGDQ